jgi:glutamine synthetase
MMKDDLVATLKASGTRFVRFVWCDSANVIRGKAVHVRRLADFWETGVGITAAHAGAAVMADCPLPASGLGPVGEVWLVPDAATLTPLPYAPGHARVFGDLMQAGRPFAPSPRHFLQTMCRQAQAEKIQVMASFECEFVLLRPTPDGLAPADDTLYASTWAMDQARVVIDAVTDALDAQGLPVEMYYPESGPGQHEITLRYTDALSAADRQVALRETVRAIAGQHGLKTSFLPKTFTDQAGSGCHVHMSLWHDGVNLLPEAHGRGQLSARGRAFLAGILDHLPALMALTTPTCNSFRRIRPHCWSGAFRCWGPDNREAAIRVPYPPAGPGPGHFELKTVDASANPYLALGGIIAAGLDGLRRALDLPEPVTDDPGNWTDAERRQRDVEALPASLAEALDHLRRDPVLLAALGTPLARAYLAIKQAELEAFQHCDLADEVKRLLERY